MRYGHFDDANREYVITQPATPCRGSITWQRGILRHYQQYGGDIPSIVMRACAPDAPIAYNNTPLITAGATFSCAITYRRSR